MRVGYVVCSCHQLPVAAISTWPSDAPTVREVQEEKAFRRNIKEIEPKLKKNILLQL